MGRILAISSGTMESTHPFNRYAVHLISGHPRNLLFIPTASGDSAGYIESITAEFSELGCEVRSLCLTRNHHTTAQLKEALSWANLIYVGGGDTLFMMEHWHRQGLDQLLQEVYRQDSALLMGISAGAMCWFSRGFTDSDRAEKPQGCAYGWTGPLLGLQAPAFCPHYEDRVSDFDLLLPSCSVEALAMESNTAFEEVNGTIRCLKSVPDARAYRLRYQNGVLQRQELTLTYI